MITSHTCSHKIHTARGSHYGSVEMNLTSIYGDTGLIPGLPQWVKDLAWAVVWTADTAWIWHCCGCGCSCGLWCRPVATALIRPPAWEPPYAMGEAPKRQKTDAADLEVYGQGEDKAPFGESKAPVGGISSVNSSFCRCSHLASKWQPRFSSRTPVTRIYGEPGSLSWLLRLHK